MTTPPEDVLDDGRPEMKPLLDADTFPVDDGEGRRLPVEGGYLLVSLTGDRGLIEEYLTTVSMGAIIQREPEPKATEPPRDLGEDMRSDEELSDGPGLDIGLNIEPEDPEPGEFSVRLAVDPSIRAHENHTYFADNITRPTVKATVNGNVDGYLSYARAAGWLLAAKDGAGNIVLTSPYRGRHELKLRAIVDSYYALDAVGFGRCP